MKFCLLLSILISTVVLGQDKVQKKLEKKTGIHLIPLKTGLSVDSSELESIASRTFDSVTIGQAYKGEFAKHFIPINVSSELTNQYITSAPVSKSEFLDFQQWVVDSTARFILYYSEEGDEWAYEWLQFNNSQQREIQKASWDLYHDRQKIATFFPLDWSKKLPYDDPSYIPHLSHLYPVRAEQFRNVKEFDQRKIYYQFGGTHEHIGRVPIFIDSYDWFDVNEHDFGKRSVLCYLDRKLNLDRPIVHIEAFMAEAYCHWRTKQFNRVLGNKGTVQCRLPKPNEIAANPQLRSQSINISAYNHTNDWRITNNEYRDFCQFSLDSLSKEYLYSITHNSEQSLELIDWQRYFYSDSDLEYIELDPEDRTLNRYYFNLSDDPIDWEDFGYANQEEMVNEIDLDSVPFRYKWMDAKSRSVKGNLYPYYPKRDSEISKYSVGQLLLEGEQLPNGPERKAGETLALHGYLKDQKGLGTRDFGNLMPFKKEEIVLVSQPSWIPQNDSIADITYEQALAYYNWKFRIDKYVNEKESGSWQQYVFPTEREFERIKSGESILHPEEEIKYDSPVFRMVVEVIPSSDK